MTSENYPDRISRAVEAMQLRAVENLSEASPFDRVPSARSGRHDAFTPDRQEYRAKGGILGIEQMFAADEEADEDEI